MKAKTRKLLALLCIVAMLATLVPTAAFAANPIYISTITGTVTGLTAPVCGAKVGTIAPKFTFTEESHATANIGSTSCWEKYDGGNFSVSKYRVACD